MIGDILFIALVLGIIFMGASAGGYFLCSCQPVLGFRLIAVAYGWFLAQFPLELRSMRYRGAEMVLRLFEANPSKSYGLSFADRDEHYNDINVVKARIEGTSIRLTKYQTGRAIRAKARHERGASLAQDEKAIIAFAQRLVDNQGKIDGTH